MEAITKRRPPLAGGLINTPDRNYAAIRAKVKRAICILALWGLLTPKTATAILRSLGVRHA